MFKKLLVIAMLALPVEAGVVKVAVYPIVHPKKSAKAFNHGANKTVKAIGKAVYNF